MTETIETPQESKINRIFTFDLVRGGAIIGILFFHRVLWDYFFATYAGGDIPPEIGLLYIFITMAGIFYVITGAVYGFMIYTRLNAGKITEKQVVLGGFVTGVLLIVYSYVFRFMLIRFLDDTMPLVNLDPTLSNGTGFLTYFILHGTLPDPLLTPFQWVGIETLGMIGITIIFVSLFLGLFYRYKRFDNPRVIYYILALTGLLILIITPFLRFLIGDTVQAAQDSGDTLLVFFTYPLTSGMMPLFPHLAYGCFGAMLGLAIARGENSRRVLLALLAVAVCFLVLGILNYGSYQGLPGQEPYTWSGNIELMARKLVQLGFFFILFLLGLGLVDYRQQQIREKWARRASPIVLFGKLALTVYMLEGIMAAILQRIISLLWTTWNSTFITIIIFGMINVVIWYITLRIWKRYEFKGSLEWALVSIVQKLSGKKSSRFRD
ncbi:MAG: hypothetical protein ACW98Y_06495 [Candidatus Thorarchaeota archaeon]